MAEAVLIKLTLNNYKMTCLGPTLGQSAHWFYLGMVKQLSGLGMKRGERTDIRVSLTASQAGENSQSNIYGVFLWACCDFDRTVRDAPFPLTTLQECWVHFPETRLVSTAARQPKCKTSRSTHPPELVLGHLGFFFFLSPVRQLQQSRG